MDHVSTLIDQEINPKMGLEIKSGGRNVTSLFQVHSLSIKANITLDILILLRIMTYFVKDDIY